MMYQRSKLLGKHFEIKYIVYLQKIRGLCAPMKGPSPGGMQSFSAWWF